MTMKSDFSKSEAPQWIAAIYNNDNTTWTGRREPKSRSNTFRQSCARTRRPFNSAHAALNNAICRRATRMAFYSYFIKWFIF